MFDPNNPNPTYEPGMMHTMNALAPPQSGGPMQPGQMPAQNNWHQDFRNALLGWRDGRPAFDPATMQRGDFRQQMMDWRGLRPDKGDFRMGVNTQPGVQTSQAFPPPQLPNTQFPLNPQGMVGQSYGVQGMTPATSPFGLPTY